MVEMTTLLDEPIVFEVSRWTLYSSVNFRLSSGVRKPWNSFSACSPRLAAVDEEQHAPGAAELDQPVDRA